MTNNKQQTAVEWLAEKTFNQIELLKHLCINEEQFLNNMLFFREQAKEMEKEKAIKLHYEYELYVMMNESVVMTFGQFYKQTYGGGKQ
jgi:hypothetical protein